MSAPTRVRALRLRARPAAVLAVVSLIGLVGFCWPLALPVEPGLAHAGDAVWLFVLLLPLLLAVVLAEISAGGMDAKAVALLGVLAAMFAALRPLGGDAAGFEPTFFLLVLAGRVLGAGFGFVLGAVGLFASALLTGGVGPWLPYQMLGAAWLGLFAGLLPPARGKAELALLAGYGAVAAFGYGVLLNLSIWPFLIDAGSTVAYVPGDPVLANLQRFAAFSLVSSLGFDIPRAVTTAVLVVVTGPPVLFALRRAARRAAFETPVEFVDRCDCC